MTNLAELTELVETFRDGRVIPPESLDRMRDLVGNLGDPDDVQIFDVSRRTVNTTGYKPLVRVAEGVLDLYNPD